MNNSLKALLLAFCAMLFCPQVCYSQKDLEYDAIDKFDKNIRNRTTKGFYLNKGSAKYDLVKMWINCKSGPNLENKEYTINIFMLGYNVGNIEQGFTLDFLLNDDNIVTLRAEQNYHLIQTGYGSKVQAEYSITETDLNKLLHNGVKYIRYQNSSGTVECAVKPKRSKNMQEVINSIIP